MIRRCAEMGFAGPIWPVHPSQGRGRTAASPSCPSAPDAAFVAVNREATVGIVRELAAIGAGGAVCHAAGFRGVRRPRRGAAGGADRGRRRDADPRPQLLRHDQLSRRGAALVRPAWRPALRARRRDPDPVRQYRPQPHHAAARPADRPSDDAGQPGQGRAVGLHRRPGRRSARHRDRPAHRGDRRRGGVRRRRPEGAGGEEARGRGQGRALRARCGAGAQPHRLARRCRRRHGRAAAPGRRRARRLAADPARDAEAAAHRGAAARPRPGHAQLLGRRGGADRRCRRRPPRALPPVRAGAGARRCARRSATSSPSPTRSTTTSSSGASPSACAPPSPRSWPAAGTSPASSSISRATDSCSDADWQVSLAAWEQARDATAGRAGGAGDPARVPARARGRGADRGRHRAAARHRRGARRRRGRGRHRRGAGRRRRPRPCCRPRSSAGEAVTLDEWRGKQLLAGVRLAASRRPAGRDPGRGRRCGRGAGLSGRGQGRRRRARPQERAGCGGAGPARCRPRSRPRPRAWRGSARRSWSSR